MKSQLKKGLHLTRRDKEGIGKAWELIVTDLKQHYTIPELAQRVNLNECKLKAGFKKMYGTGIWTCLSRLRLKKAQEMLQENELSVKEVAYALGYDYVANFITCYKRKFGCTPGEERQKGSYKFPPEIKIKTPEIKNNGFGSKERVSEF